MMDLQRQEIKSKGGTCDTVKEYSPLLWKANEAPWYERRVRAVTINGQEYVVLAILHNKI